MFNMTGRLLMGIISVGLVFLISIQILMGFDQTRNYLRWAESQLGIIKQPEVQEVGVAVAGENVTLRLLNSGDYSGVRVLVNNEKVYYFTDSLVKIPVKNGDLLILDARGFGEALWFEVEEYSPIITTLREGQQFRVKNGLEVIEISFNYGEKL